MAITTDILRTWRHPRAVIRQMLDRGPDEGRALAILMGACALIFVAQAPRLAREAQLSPDIPLDARLGVSLFALIFMAPLLFYAIAGISRLIAKLFGGRGTGFGARLALFWALLATTPAMLLHGLASGLMGPVAATTALGIVVALVFVTLWMQMLIEAES
ncbi:MAG: YIP1 family protein [Pseudomonadota bacterium]